MVVAAEAGLRLSPTRMRVPDVMVVDRAPDGPWVTEPPLLAAEVLSPSTRSEDTVRKSAEYADAGVGQFWVVDPDHRTIDVYRNVDGGWEPVAHLDAATPTAEVAVAPEVFRKVRRCMSGRDQGFWILYKCLSPLR